MTNKIYKTSQGKDIDLGKLMIQNEEVRAVGNMNVNARGDVIDSGNKKVSDSAARVNRNYRKQIGNVVKDMPVMNSKRAAQAIAQKYVDGSSDLPMVNVINGLDGPVMDTSTQFGSPAATADKAPIVPPRVTNDEMGAVLEEVATKAKGGLAGAIAKAREVKQEPLKTPREEERGIDGVNKI
jgi:hypothetical protein